MPVLRSTFLAVAVLVSACAGSTEHDFLRDIEHRAYDSLAGAVSTYCVTVQQVVPRTSIELAREIRQRGRDGPPGPLVFVPGLDDKTAQGPGPVMQIWCLGETVPEAVWPLLVRDWRD